MHEPTTRPPEDQDVREETIALLGIKPRLVRLLTAVHEAGHAVVADSVGAHVSSVTVLSDGGLTDPRGGNDHAAVIFRGVTSVDDAFAEYLTVLTAGFQAQYMWLCRSRRVPYTQQLQTGLTWLAAGDITPANALRERCGREDVAFRDAQLIAGMILKTRWSTLLRLAYYLTRTGYVDEQGLHGHFAADQPVRAKCLTYFQRWKQQVEDGTFRDHEVYSRVRNAQFVNHGSSPEISATQ